jgi:hypothetical protein
MCSSSLQGTVWDQLRQRDLKALARFLPASTITAAASRAGVAVGRGPLHLGNLVWLALASALHPRKSFADVLCLVLKLLQDAADWSTSPLAVAQRRGQQQARRQQRHKHDPRGYDPTRLSEEAFVQARRKMPGSFWTALLVGLSDAFEAAHGDRVRWKGFRLLALDGTTVLLDNWRRLTAYFGSARNGRGRPRTQARLVMLQWPLVRLPWRYELTPLADGERTVAGRLLGALRDHDLVLMDRGFWSYGAFWQIQNQHAFFAIRKVAQVKWRRVRRLDRGDYLMRWQPRDQKKKWRDLPKSLLLRYLPYQLPGFRPSGVVTNVLDPQAITREDWLRLAVADEAGRVLEPGLYHRRWEIETTFRELKVTQGMEGSLRSRTPEGIRYEVAGHVLLYFLVRWLLVEAAAQAGVDDPLRLSFKGALAELADMQVSLLLADPWYARRVLLPRLLQRIASHRVPLRPGRHYARPRDTQAKYKGKGRYQKASKKTCKET